MRGEKRVSRMALGKNLKGKREKARVSTPVQVMFTSECFVGSPMSMEKLKMASHNWRGTTENVPLRWIKGDK